MLARIRKSTEEKDQGFTLIELLVVIIIIGILAAIAIPVFLSQRKKGWDSQAKSDTRNLATLEETYLTDSDVYTTSVAAAGDIKDFKKSASVTTVETAVNAGNGFCVVATSKSGNAFLYDSQSGGLKPVFGGGATAANVTAAKTACTITSPTWAATS